MNACFAAAEIASLSEDSAEPTPIAIAGATE